MSNNCKTPVMILQELMVKLKYTPEFSLTRQTGNTHDPIFEFLVTAKNVTATGHGRSKKDAKHDAARNALKKLSEMGIYHPENKEYDYQPKDSPPDSPDLSEMIQMNYVGHLKDFCTEKRLPDPVFEIISDIGPPHARQFTLECAVGSIKCIKTSTTKKSAKQIASKQMLQLLMDTVDCGGIVVPCDELHSGKYDDEAAEKHEELKQVTTNLSRKISDYHKCIKEELALDLREKGMAFLKNVSYEDVGDVVEYLDKVLHELEINYSLENLPCKERGKIGLSVKLQTDPPFEIAAYDISYERVKVVIAQRSLEFFKIMLQ